MGAKRRQQSVFLAANALCCFCGGNTPATTEDHVPPRVLFKGRVWPEGYVFPACENCNGATRQVELAVALVGRFNPRDANVDDPDADREFRSILVGLRNNQPKLLLELQPTANETKAFLRKRGIEMPFGLTSAQVPLVRLNGPLVRAAVREFARKLLLALHYRETKKIIPLTGGMTFRWWSNVQIIEGKFPSDVLQYMDRIPLLRRARTEISGQFAYRYNVSDDGELGAFAVRFGESFVITGFTAFDSAVLISGLDSVSRKSRKNSLLRPFCWE